MSDFKASEDGLRTEREARIIEWEVYFHDLRAGSVDDSEWLHCTHHLCAFVRDSLLYDVSTGPAKAGHES